MSQHLHDFKTTVKESLLRLVFEMTGTALLTSLWLSCFSSGDRIGFYVGYFVLLVFSARISGSHFNPAVTLAFMVRKETGGFSRVLGIAYIIFQILGGFLGALLTFSFFHQRPIISLTMTPNGGYLIVQSILIQVVAAAILVFLYLTQTEEKTKLSDDNAITTLIIAAAYYVAVIWSSSYGDVQNLNPVNPAIAFGDSCGMLFEPGNQSSGGWLFWLMPFGGSLLAVLLFELVFKKAAAAVEEQNQAQEGDGAGLLANE